jgi:DNA helicase HerA-like ATPase
MLEIQIGSTAAGQIISQPMKLANRHGLIAGATGTGKTVTLQHLIEVFSDAGVAVFAADVKGDLTGLAKEGKPSGKILERIESMPWLNWHAKGYPLVSWDIYGKTGHPLRTTISQMGPLLLTALLELTDTQQAILNLVFQYAVKEGLLLLDFKDLKSTINYVKENPSVLGENASLFSAQSAAALQRKLANLEAQGANDFFGEPALDLDDMLQLSSDGKGYIHMLDATKVVHDAPKIYATFLLWLLSELFEKLPERGDADKPKMVLFFDEAHLMFDGTPKVLQDKIEQVVRLIRSKGVGVYFITQSPKDIPDGVLAQLGLKIQHALRAFTEKERKALKAVAQGFRANPKIDTLDALVNLGIGEALIGILDEKGIPSMVEQAFIAPPQSRLGPITEGERLDIINSSPVKAKYNEVFDRYSAYEKLKEQAEAKQAMDAFNQRNNPQPTKTTASRPTKVEKSFLDTALTQVTRNVQRKATNQIGTAIVRGLLGTLFGGKK